MKKSPNTNSSAPFSSLLKQLGGMTAFRHMHLVELSLLRTLGPLLGVSTTSLYKVDQRNVVNKVLNHSRSFALGSGDLQRISEHIEELNNPHIDDIAINSLLDTMRLIGRSTNFVRDQRYLYGFPLNGADQLYGYFVFERDSVVTDIEEAVIHGVLEVFSNYYGLLDSSQRDQLTGLQNRYSLEVNLARLWDLLGKKNHHINGVPEESGRRRVDTFHYWIGIFDVDNFKKVNDSYGHIIGDEVLLLTSRLLESALRRGDLIYRYGGEEFIAIIAAERAEEVAKVFERARSSIEQFTFPQVGKISISGGYCALDCTVLPQTIINRADRALYKAKNDGRNRIYDYNELIESGQLEEIRSGTIDLF